MSNEAIAEARRVLHDLVNGRVPDSVNRGGHGTAVQFKKAIENARKALASQRSTLVTLQQAAQSLRAFQN